MTVSSSDSTSFGSRTGTCSSDRTSPSTRIDGRAEEER
jgi:hypothetical protein